MGKLRLSRDQFGSFLKQNPQFIREFERLFQEIDDAIDSLNLAPPVQPATSGGGGGGPPSGPAGGDLTGTYPNPTIATGVVDNTKLANMTGPTFKARDTGTGAPQDVNPADATTILLAADPGTTMKVVGKDTVSGQMFEFANLTHNSTTKTTTTSTLVATDVQTATATISESALAPTAIANKAIIYVDSSNRVLAMKETGVPQRLDAIRVADSGAIQGTRWELNFTGAGVTVTDDAGNDRVNIDIPGGGGGGTFGQATATFTGNQSAVTVNVSDAGVSGTSNIVLSVDMGSRLIDEFEMAPVIPVVGNIVPGVGFDILVACPGRDAVGAYLINYTRD